jgi:hypothetical protein
MFSKLVETEIHESEIITEANVKYAEFCDIIVDLPQEIQDYILVSNYLVRAFTYKQHIETDRSLFQQAIIKCVEEALERLELQHLLILKDDES